ncbi:unnamed protein product, partial [Prorocentrum cordatum]
MAAARERGESCLLEAPGQLPRPQPRGRDKGEGGLLDVVIDRTPHAESWPAEGCPTPGLPIRSVLRTQDAGHEVRGGACRRAPAHGEHPSLTSHTPRRVRLRELSHAREKRAQPSNHHDAGRRRGGGVLAARRQRAGGRASDRNTARARRGATARRRRGRPPHTSQLVEGLRAGPRAAGRAEAGLPPGQHERLVRHLAGGARASAGAEPPGRSARRAEVTAGKPPRALPRGLGVLGASRGL